MVWIGGVDLELNPLPTKPRGSKPTGGKLISLAQRRPLDLHVMFTGARCLDPWPYQWPGSSKETSTQLPGEPCILDVWGKPESWSKAMSLRRLTCLSSVSGLVTLGAWTTLVINKQFGYFCCCPFTVSEVRSAWSKAIRLRRM